MNGFECIIRYCDGICLLIFFQLSVLHLFSLTIFCCIEAGQGDSSFKSNAVTVREARDDKIPDLMLHSEMQPLFTA